MESSLKPRNMSVPYARIYEYIACNEISAVYINMRVSSCPSSFIRMRERVSSYYSRKRRSEELRDGTRVARWSNGFNEKVFVRAKILFGSSKVGSLDK